MHRHRLCRADSHHRRQQQEYLSKGSVRKKGKKWYARFYIEDESGRKVQKEFVGTESKSETEALLRNAIADYEEKKFVATSGIITVGMLLDLWSEKALDANIMLQKGVVINNCFCFIFSSLFTVT